MFSFSYELSLLNTVEPIFSCSGFGHLCLLNVCLIHKFVKLTSLGTAFAVLSTFAEEIAVFSLRFLPSALCHLLFLLCLPRISF